MIHVIRHIDPLRMPLHDPAVCECDCPGGQPCVLRPDVRHQLHVCRYAACICHTKQRYVAAVAVKQGGGEG